MLEFVNDSAFLLSWRFMTEDALLTRSGLQVSVYVGIICRQWFPDKATIVNWKGGFFGMCLTIQLPCRTNGTARS